MRNQRRIKPRVERCSHPSRVAVREFDPKTGESVLIGHRCVKCRLFWKK